MIKILLILLLISGTAFAETYTVEKPDGSLVIAHYFENSQDTLEEFLESLGLEGLPVSRIDPSTFPPREDRKYWKKSGNNIVIDTVKKQADLDAEAAKQAEKDAVLTKLKISREELEKLKV